MKWNGSQSQVLGFMSSCNALSSDLLSKVCETKHQQQQQHHHLLHHQHLCFWNLESDSHQALLHPRNKLRFVTLNFRSVPLDCCISCLLQNFRQAPMANCIIVNRCEWWGTCQNVLGCKISPWCWIMGTGLCSVAGPGSCETSSDPSRLSAVWCTADSSGRVRTREKKGITPLTSARLQILLWRSVIACLHLIWLYKGHHRVQAQNDGAFDEMSDKWNSYSGDQFMWVFSSVFLKYLLLKKTFLAQKNM